MAGNNRLVELRGISKLSYYIESMDANIDKAETTPAQFTGFDELNGDPKVWYVFRDHKHFGPFNMQWIQEFLAVGALDQKHFVWKSGLEGWTRIERFENFKAFVSEEKRQKISDLEFESILRAEDLRQKRLDLGGQVVPTLPAQIEIIEDVKDVIEPVFENWKTKALEAWSRLSVRERAGVILGPITIVSLLLAVTIDWRFSTAEKEIYQRLNPVQKVKVDKILSEEQVFADDILIGSDKGSEMIVVVPEDFVGKNHEVELISEPFQSVGVPRANMKMTITPQGRLLVINRGQLMQARLPEGEYKAQILCDGCTEPIMAGSFSFFRSTRPVLKRQIQDYRSTLVTQAELESDEISQLVDAMYEHFDFTVGEFAKARNLKGAKRKKFWNAHLGRWKNDQAQFDEVLSSLDSTEFKNQLVYIETYEGLARLNQSIKALQAKQSEIFKSPSNVNISKASMMVTDLKKSFDDAKTDLQAAVINFKKEVSR